MSAPVLSGERRWYRVAHWSLAVSALTACLYFLATSRGWLPGISGSTHSLLMMGSSTALIWSFLVLGWHQVLALILIGLSAVLLIWSIVSFVQTY